MQKPPANRLGLARIWLEREHLHTVFETRLQVPQHVGGTIGTAVVHHDEGDVR
jgi:hypothetical protein